MRPEAIASLLPRVFRRTIGAGSPLEAVIEVMAELQTPCEQRIEELDVHLDPWRAPEASLPFLAAWVDLERLFDPAWLADETPDAAVAPISSGTWCLRRLIACAADLSRMRGTRRGLATFLEVATGHAGFAIRDDVRGKDGRPIAFHLRIEAPPASAPHEALIRRIVDQEKPVHVTYELDFANRTNGGAR